MCLAGSHNNSIYALEAEPANCSEIQRVTSSVFVHPLLAFCRRSPQFDTTSVLRFHRGHQPWRNFAERLPTIPELIGSVNASAFIRWTHACDPNEASLRGGKLTHLAVQGRNSRDNRRKISCLIDNQRGKGGPRWLQL